MNADDRGDLNLLRAEVMGKLDLIVAKISHAADAVGDHESRLRRLESKRSLSPAQATLLASCIAALAAVAVALIK